MISAVKSYFVNLNIFEPSPDSNEREDDQQRRLNIISTRIYLVVLLLILFLFGLYTKLNFATSIITIEYPTEDQFEKLPQDARCHCSHISISYGDFVSLQTTIHQVCVSDFVSDRWINALFFGLNTSFFDIYDFRITASSQFEALAGFCRLSQANILQSISSFYKNKLITPQILSKKTLEAQVEGLIKQFQLTISNNFNNQLKLVREMTMANQLKTALPISMIPAYYYDDYYGYFVFMINIGIEKSDGSICACEFTPDCIGTSGIYKELAPSSLYFDTNKEVAMTISGLVGSCLPVDIALFSTLECFYNQSCIDKLVSFLPKIETFKALKVDNQSRFELNATIKSIVNQLMIENWKKNITYEKYYKQCAPISCIYSILKRPNFKYTSIRLISLLSGLTVVLGIIIPIIIKFSNRLKNRQPTPHISLNNRIHQLKIQIKILIIELNIFKHYPSTDRQIHYQRIATRLYIIFLLISLTILSIYLSLNTEIQKKILLNPTENQYIQLQEIYSDNLLCPCTNISMNYSTFITIQPYYHQLCSSDLISLKWLDYTKFNDPNIDLVSTDYRASASTQFRLLKILCEQAEQIITNSLNIFLQTDFISSKVISIQLFESQINSSIQEWQSYITNRFLLTIELFQSISQGNLLMNGKLNTNITTNYISRETKILPKTYGNCTCGISQSCSTSLRIYSNMDEYPQIIELYHISNFFIGCFPFEALLASTLEFFYNKSQMIILDRYMQFPMKRLFNFSSLDSTRNIPNEIINSIIKRIMVDSWLSRISFSSYYYICAPLSCVYEYSSRNDILFIVTSIVGLFGGLSLGIKLFLLITLRFIYKIMNGVNRIALLQSIKNICICQNEHQIINRLHFLLIIIVFCIVYSFSVLTPQTITINTKKPSLDLYEDLLKHYSNTLQCSCSQISMKHEVFLTIKPYFHQICSSDFINSDWMEYLYNNNNDQYSFYAQFQLLASFCQLSQQTVNNALSQLIKTNFINDQLLSSKVLNGRIKIIIDEFQLTLPDNFLNILSLIRETISANKFMSVLSTNWIFFTPSQINYLWTAHTIPINYGECNCGLSSKCIQSSKGMLIGCYPLETLLQMDLNCFYDQQCIDSNKTFQALNVSYLQISHFNSNNTIESLINKLMIEEFYQNISYEKYFDQCAPSSCTYSYIDQTNIIQGLTNIISLYGGLMVICRVIVVTIVKIFRHQKERRIISIIN
ncbi:unnamed protein product [Adineta ricciae]|uniref:Uncharacterized protein n=1 Tax=Adineta ricciae TaxID=249248 RepID=A0A815VKV8_ADIRI|nr:unnamed protein product [Adineta ricciae]CAF1557065.1 unnamed protein product [Adineta ricciae]